MPDIILYERDGQWAQSLQRASQALGRETFEIHNCRALAHCGQALERWPSGFLALELSQQQDEAVLQALAAISWQYPQAAAVVLCRRGAENRQWIARELGAIAVFCTPRDLRPVVKMAQRHHNRLPRPDLSPQEQVWQELPWPPVRGRQ